MLQYIIEENNLMPFFESYGLTDMDITFVKVFVIILQLKHCLTFNHQELIYGPFQQGSGDYIGRGKEKFFLYEIVANKTNSIDVDKVLCYL